MKKSHTRGFAPLVVIIIIVALAAGGVLVYRENVGVNQVQEITPVSTNTISQIQEGSISSFTITPSTKNGQSWTMYKKGAKAVLKAKNITSAELWYTPTGTEMKSTFGGTMSKIDQETWELELPENLLTTSFWAEVTDLSGKKIKSADLGNVGYEGNTTSGIYRNSELGIYFKYPKTWDLLTKTHEPSEDVDGYWATISNANDDNLTYASLYSEGFEVHGMPTSGTIGSIQSILTRCPVLAVSCKKFTISGRQGIDIVEAYKDEAGFLNTRRMVYLSNPTGKYSVIILRAILPSLTQQTGTALPGTIEEKELYVSKVSTLLKNGSISLAEKNRLAGLDTILSTLSFL